MQADKDQPAAAAAAAPPPAPALAPSICDRLQGAFHARPAFRPLRRHEDGSGAGKPAGAGDGASAAPAPARAPKYKRPPPPVPAAPRATATAPQSEQPVPVRLPAVTGKVAAGGAPTGPPVPVPPPDVVAGMATAADAKAGDVGQQSKGKTRVGSRVRKALSSKQ